jgi:hypothetical protein
MTQRVGKRLGEYEDEVGEYKGGGRGGEARDMSIRFVWLRVPWI